MLHPVSFGLIRPPTFVHTLTFYQSDSKNPESRKAKTHIVDASDNSSSAAVCTVDGDMCRISPS